MDKLKVCVSGLDYLKISNIPTLLGRSSLNFLPIAKPLIWMTDWVKATAKTHSNNSTP